MGWGLGGLGEEESFVNWWWFSQWASLQRIWCAQGDIMELWRCKDKLDVEEDVTSCLGPRWCDVYLGFLLILEDGVGSSGRRGRQEFVSRKDRILLHNTWKRTRNMHTLNNKVVCTVRYWSLMSQKTKQTDATFKMTPDKKVTPDSLVAWLLLMNPSKWEVT